MLKNPKQLKFISPLNIPNGKSKDVKITHESHPAGEPITVVSMRDFIFTGQKALKVCYNEPVSYTILKDKNGIWMTDVPAEQASAHGALRKCKGRVLVGGLGLGYFAKKLQEKDNVTSVIIVEISKDVINLVWRHLKLDKRFIIVCMDIKKYLKKYTSNRRFDWVYLDVWHADSEYEFMDNVLPLKRLAHKYVCDKVNHVLSWQEDVMLGQIHTGLITRIQLNFDEIISMNTEKFNKEYKPSNKYLATCRAFWLFVRKHKLNPQDAIDILPVYIMWIRNGMQKGKWEN